MVVHRFNDLRKHTTGLSFLVWLCVVMSSWIVGVPKSDDPVFEGALGLSIASAFARSLHGIAEEMKELTDEAVSEVFQEG
jgi:hypothetical protein